VSLALWGWALVHFSWQAILLAGGLALGLRAGGLGARVRYGAAYATLLLLLLLPALDAGYLVWAGRDPRALAVGGAAVAPALLAGAYDALTPVTRWLAVLWVVLAATMLLRWLGGWWLTIRLGRWGTRPAPQHVIDALARAARRVGVRRRVTIALSSVVTVPTLIGTRHPRILVPATLAALAARELEAILAHELGHVRRHDGLANLIQVLVESLLCFHPAVWWVSRAVRHEREASCDEIAVRAVGDPRTYARALARLEVLRADATTLALAATGGSLAARLERLTRPGPRVPAGLGMAALASGGGVAAALLAVAGQALLPGTLVALRPGALAPSFFVVHASDPAGAFTIAVEHGRVVRAVVGGVRVPAERIEQRGDSVVLPWARGSFSLKLRPQGFSWSSRTP
jgi:beta-lactamase regulating signal transducer with metallopeptidase domain